MRRLESILGLNDQGARSLERGAPVLAAGFSLFYLGAYAVEATRKFWFDELYTFYLSRLPTFGAIWSALKDGADLNPPVLYWAVRASHALLGETHLATRLPAIIGFLVMSWCLFVFVSRRCGKLYGIAAMVFPTLTGACTYAAEARPYSLVLGFVGLALVSWQSAADGRWRQLALPGLSLSLAAALLSHCYAVFPVMALIAGELARTFSRRRIDGAMWASLALPLPAMLAYAPLLSAARGYITLPGYFFAPRIWSVPQFYSFLLLPALCPLLAACLIRPSSGERASPSPIDPPPARLALPLHELVCALGLLLVPVAAVLFAMVRGGGYMDRYGLVSVIGASILVVLFVHHENFGRRVSGAALALLFSAFFLISAIARGTSVGERKSPAQPFEAPDFSHLATDRLPVAISNGLMFLEANHYASPELASRLCFLMNQNAALEYTRTNLFDRAYPTLRKWFPIRGSLIGYDEFLSTHQRFLLYGPHNYPEDWLIRKLLADGVVLVLKGQFQGPYGDTVLLEATVDRSPKVEPLRTGRSGGGLLGDAPGGR